VSVYYNYYHATIGHNAYYCGAEIAPIFTNIIIQYDETVVAVSVPDTTNISPCGCNFPIMTTEQQGATVLPQLYPSVAPIPTMPFGVPSELVAVGIFLGGLAVVLVSVST
jgi:hypothetical protein